MKYYFKKGFSFRNKKKVDIYSISSEKLPFFVGGKSLEVVILDSVDEFINVVNEDKNSKYFSFTNLSQEDLNSIIKGIKNRIVEFEYTDVRCGNKPLDLKVLKLCKKLKKVSINYAEAPIILWNMRFNHKLEEVEIINACRILNQKGLLGAKLKKLTIRRHSHGTPDTKELVIKDFSVFETMPHLEELTLLVKKKKDKSKDLISLSKLNNIKKIELTKNYFYFNQYAWLSSKLPGVKGIGCYKVEYDHANEMDGYIINGSRMCWYIRGFEKAKLRRYISKFDNLVEMYKNEENPPLK
jgi:hypothetical protein